MAEVTLVIGGRPHTLACRAGEEQHLLNLGKRLDAEWATANRAAGGLDSERAMLFLALIMADSLDEAERRPPGEGAGEATLMRVADKLEKLATALEQNPAGA